MLRLTLPPAAELGEGRREGEDAAREEAGCVEAPLDHPDDGENLDADLNDGDGDPIAEGQTGAASSPVRLHAGRRRPSPSGPPVPAQALSSAVVGPDIQVGVLLPATNQHPMPLNVALPVVPRRLRLDEHW